MGSLILSYIYTFAFFIYSLLGVNTWSYGVIGQPNSFLPNESFSDSEKLVSDLLFRKLVTVDPETGEVKNDLLESYSIKGDSRIYQVKLKKGQYWHDGVEITANDLLYTASINTSLREVSFDKVDDYTVSFVLPNQYSPFLSVLSIPLMPQHLAEKNSQLNPVGSGDYRLVRIERDRAKVKSLYLVDTSNNAPYKILKIEFYDNEDNLITGARLFEIDSFLLNQKKDLDGFNRKKYAFGGRNYLVIFNTEKEELDKNTRINIRNSINFDELLQEQEYEAGEVPKGPFSHTWAQDPNIDYTLTFSPVTIDIDRSLNLVAPDVRQARLISENIKEQLQANSGLSVNVEYLPASDFTTAVRDTDYDIILMAHEYGFDPDRYIFWHSSQNNTGLNYSNYSSIRTDKALTEGREELDMEKRKEHYNIFETVFNEEVPAFFIVHPTQFLYYSSGIEKVPDSNVFYPWQILHNFNKWQKQEDTKVL